MWLQNPLRSLQRSFYIFCCYILRVLCLPLISFSLHFRHSYSPFTGRYIKQYFLLFVIIFHVIFLYNTRKNLACTRYTIIYLIFSRFCCSHDVPHTFWYWQDALLSTLSSVSIFSLLSCFPFRYFVLMCICCMAFKNKRPN